MRPIISLSSPVLSLLNLNSPEVAPSCVFVILITGLLAVEFDIFISSASIAKVSPSVPIDSMLGCAAVVTVPAVVAVSAFPVTSPVTSPVIVPSTVNAPSNFTKSPSTHKA